MSSIKPSFIGPALVEYTEGDSPENVQISIKELKNDQNVKISTISDLGTVFTRLKSATTNTGANIVPDNSSMTEVQLETEITRLQSIIDDSNTEPSVKEKSMNEKIVLEAALAKKRLETPEIATPEELAEANDGSNLNPHRPIQGSNPGSNGGRRGGKHKRRTAKPRSIKLKKSRRKHKMHKHNMNMNMHMKQHSF